MVEGRVGEGRRDDEDLLGCGAQPGQHRAHELLVADLLVGAHQGALAGVRSSPLGKSLVYSFLASK